MDNKVKKRFPIIGTITKTLYSLNCARGQWSLVKNIYIVYNEDGDWQTVAQAQYRALYGEYKITKTELMSDVCNLPAVSMEAPNTSSYTKNYANLSWESKYTPQSAQRDAHGFHIQRPGPQKSNQTIIYNYMLLEFLHNKESY